VEENSRKFVNIVTSSLHLVVIHEGSRSRMARSRLRLCDSLRMSALSLCFHCTANCVSQRSSVKELAQLRASRSNFCIEIWDNLLSLPLAIIQIPANLPRILHSIREIDSRPPESLRRHFLQLLKLTLRRIQATRTAIPSVIESLKIAKNQETYS
jgi:hypothetical protein